MQRHREWRVNISALNIQTNALTHLHFYSPEGQKEVLVFKFQVAGLCYCSTMECGIHDLISITSNKKGNLLSKNKQSSYPPVSYTFSNLC